MAEAGGTATQAGIFYQNSVAAMALAELLDFDPRSARERATEVRLEAPEDVDDIVIRFADEHRRFQNVKLSIRVGNSAWSGIWRSLSAQHGSPTFGSNDQLTLVVEEKSSDSEAVGALCERAASSIDDQELRARLTGPQGRGARQHRGNSRLEYGCLRVAPANQRAASSLGGDRARACPSASGRGPVASPDTASYPSGYSWRKSAAQRLVPASSA